MSGGKPREETWARVKAEVQAYVPESARMMNYLLRRSGATRPEALMQITEMGRWYCSRCRSWLPMESFYTRWHKGHKTIPGLCVKCDNDQTRERKQRHHDWTHDQLVLLRKHAGKWSIDRFLAAYRKRFGVPRTRDSVLSALYREGLAITGGSEGFVSGKELADLLGWHRTKVAWCRDWWGMPAREIAFRVHVYSLEAVLRWASRERPEVINYTEVPDDETLLAFTTTLYSEADVEAYRKELGWPPCFKVVQCASWAVHAYGHDPTPRDHRYFMADLYDGDCRCPDCGTRSPAAAIAYADTWADGAHMTLDAYELAVELPVHQGPILFPREAVLLGLIGKGSDAGYTVVEIAGLAKHDVRRVRRTVKQLVDEGLVERRSKFNHRITGAGRRIALQIRHDIATPDGLEKWRRRGRERQGDA